MNRSSPVRWLCSAAIACSTAGYAISPAQLQQLLNSGEKITFVDVRSVVLFQKGHIPGAINIVAPLVPEKQLPPLGRVIAYDDGLGRNTVEAAVAALNQKPGITAEALDGGYAAWEMTESATTRPGGMKPEEMPFITYADLKKASAKDMVLVDLRKRNPAKAANEPGLKSAQPPLTDLQSEFPDVRVSRSPFDVPGVRPKSLSSGPPPLLVLIDSGDGTAQAMARTLRANGVTRFAILAGGEDILARKGEPGLQRIGSSITVGGGTTNSPPVTHP